MKPVVDETVDELVTLAFYKGAGKLIDKPICWWTQSRFSHVVVIINGVVTRS